MLVLLLAIAVVALTVLALLVAGAVTGIVTGIGLLNLFALVIGMRSRRHRPGSVASERWRPRSFRRLPGPLEPEAEEDVRSRSLTVHRR